MMLLEKISKDYQARGDEEHQRPAIHEIDLRIDAGEMVALIGDSSSGTSTLLNILGLLERPSSGSYRLGQTDTTRLSERKLRKLRGESMGFAMSAFDLLGDASVARNVELPLVYAVRPRKRRRRALQALERVGMGDHPADMPVELFPAQRRRAIIARALVHQPGVLLHGDPTADLDVPSANEIMELLTELNRAGTTILFSTAEERIADFAPRVVRLSEGRIVADARSQPAEPT